MPKSSIASRTPSARQRVRARRCGARRVGHDRALGDLELERARPGALSDGEQAHRRRPAAAGRAGSRIDEVDRDRRARGPRRATRGTARSASSSTRSVSGRISPVCSASGMNSSGQSRPRSGCCQRTSASTLRTRPVAEVGLRLVVEHELVARRSRAAARPISVEPARRRAGRARPRRSRRRCAPLATYIATSARCMRLSTSVAVIGEQRDADRRLDVEREALDDERRARARSRTRLGDRRGDVRRARGRGAATRTRRRRAGRPCRCRAGTPRAAAPTCCSSCVAAVVAERCR